MASDQIESLYKSIPKVELHVHLDGACPLATLRSIAEKRNLPLPWNKENEFHDLVSLAKPETTLRKFLDKFDVVVDTIGGSSEAIELVTFEYCRASVANGVIYSELQFAPHFLMTSSIAPDKQTLTVQQVVEAVLRGVARGKSELGITVNLIPVCIGQMPYNSSAVVNIAAQYHGRGVVAVGLAGEELFPIDQRHSEAFKKAQDLGLPIVAHAGESGPACNVQQAIELMKVRRIGHGYHVLDDEAIYQMAKESGVHFETCPLSSIYTGSQKMTSHAIKRFAEDNVNFSINSDDPCIMRSSLVQDYIVAATELGLTYKQIKQTVLNGVGATLLAPDEKETLRKEVVQKFTEIEQLYKL